MANWNIELRSRKTIIEIKRIIERVEEGPADFPAIKFIDQKGREQSLAYIDLTSAEGQWKRIQEGSKIELTLRESVVGLTVLPKSSL